MSTIRKRVASRIAKELREAGWVECEELRDCYHHRDFGVHALFDAAYVQRDAAELTSRGWSLTRVGNSTYFQHEHLGRHMAHAALMVQQQANLENGRQKALKWFCFLLFVALMSHALYLFMGV